MAIVQIARRVLDQLQVTMHSSDAPGPIAGYLCAVGIGTIAGTRSTLPLALLSWEKDPRDPDTLSLSQLLDSQAARIITATFSAGEIIADKLPFLPDRLSPPAFIWRLFIGGLAGTIMTYRLHDSPILGAVLGSSAAALGTVAGYYSRKTLGRRTLIPDPILGAFEDVLATGLGLLVVRKAVPVAL